ncbi:MAG: hypothetical protein EKK46_17690 [Rhodocyclaceae bacterium]|nr:MAG: hypothetical protein EKK46_17690 [Rhodocyclaceae bacterium]
MKRFFKFHAPFAACVLALALAPTHAIAQGADPADPGAPVPPASYHNALQSFRSAPDAPVGDWKAANAQVSKVGKTVTPAADAHADHPHGDAEATGKAQQTPAGHEAHNEANCMEHMKHKGMHKDMMSMGEGKHHCHHPGKGDNAGPMHCQHAMKHGGDHE